MKALIISLSLVVMVVVINPGEATTFNSDLVTKLLSGYQPHVLPQKVIVSLPECFCSLKYFYFGIITIIPSLIIF